MNCITWRVAVIPIIPIRLLTDHSFDRENNRRRLPSIGRETLHAKVVNLARVTSEPLFMMVRARHDNRRFRGEKLDL
jgi:hypothetical protein